MSIPTVARLGSLSVTQGRWPARCLMLLIGSNIMPCEQWVSGKETGNSTRTRIGLDTNRSSGAGIYFGLTVGSAENPQQLKQCHVVAIATRWHRNWLPNVLSV